MKEVNNIALHNNSNRESFIARMLTQNNISPLNHRPTQIYITIKINNKLQTINNQIKIYNKPLIIIIIQVLLHGIKQMHKLFKRFQTSKANNKI